MLMQAPCQFRGKAAYGSKKRKVFPVIDINVGNVITIGLIGILTYAALKFGLKATGYSPAWL